MVCQCPCPWTIPVGRRGRDGDRVCKSARLFAISQTSSVASETIPCLDPLIWSVFVAQRDPLSSSSRSLQMSEVNPKRLILLLTGFVAVTSAAMYPIYFYPKSRIKEYSEYIESYSPLSRQSFIACTDANSPSFTHPVPDDRRLTFADFVLFGRKDPSRK